MILSYIEAHWSVHCHHCRELVDFLAECDFVSGSFGSVFFFFFFFFVTVLLAEYDLCYWYF